MKRKRTFLLPAALFAIMVWTLWSNTALEVTEYVISSSKIPEDFSDFRIAHISDFHNADYWDRSGDLIRLLKESNPDIIVITGDMIDSRNTDIPKALTLAAEAVSIAPTYYVTGNHESRISDLHVLLEGLQNLGVMVLDNKTVPLQHGDAVICLMGTEDPTLYAYGNVEHAVAKVIDGMKQESYTILLAHRPELFPVYAECGIDLTLAGHVHGGQARLPLIGGLVGPNQGFFPKYDAGHFCIDDSEMVLSRGIGNSVVPVRFNNRPQIPLIILQHR